MKLFLICLEIRNGENEYISYHVTRAKTLKSAERKAEKYARGFFGERHTVAEDGGYYAPDYSEFIHVDGVEEVTTEQVIARLMI